MLVAKGPQWPFPDGSTPTRCRVKAFLLAVAVEEALSQPAGRRATPKRITLNGRLPRAHLRLQILASKADLT